MATARNAHGGPHGRLDFESETFVASRPVAATLTRGAESSGKGGYAGRRQEDDDNLIAHSIRAKHNLALRADSDTLVALSQAVAFQPRFARNDRGAPDVIASPLTAEAGRTGKGDSAQCVAFTVSEMSNGFAWERDVWQTLDAQVPNDSSNIQKGIRQGWAVRRLTPTECERLQGFPDGYTLIKLTKAQRKAVDAEMAEYWRRTDQELSEEDLRRLAADGPRYKALGNSWAVNCARWIGRRIEMVERLAAEFEREHAA